MGITWEFVEAVADVVTSSTTEHQRLLTEARPLWERVLANAECQDFSQTTDIVATMREMLDLSQQLREVQNRLADLRAEDQSLAWALVMTCQQMRTRIAALRANQATPREISAWSWPYGSVPHRLTWAEIDGQTAHLLEEWTRRIAHFAQVLVRPEDTGPAANTSLGLSEAIETTLRELDLDLAQTTRHLDGPAAASFGFSDELTELDPEYTGGGFLRAVRLDSERLRPECFLPDDMTDAVMEPGSDHVLTIPMVGLVRQGIAIAPGITVLAGPNGVGKSVVLEALSHALQGDRARRASGYRPLSQRLATALEITFHHRPRPQDVWYASYLGLRTDRDSRLSARESFRIALEEMSPKPGVLYLLDEPEAALAAPLTEDLVSWMNDRVEDGCQFIVATHSMTLAALEHAQVIMPGR
ncbi:AAA family ATPase [Streptomyces sp. NPDC087317]|uniref:AAA family ATPase n=1 Tax=Streptomyces sp. NPDC087317 TaxID=3365784 RepID=UPI00381324EE